MGKYLRNAHSNGERNKAAIWIANGIRIILILALASVIGLIAGDIYAGFQEGFTLREIWIDSSLGERFLTIFTAILLFTMTYFPAILEKKMGIYLPTSIQIPVLLFVFGALYLGEMSDFYFKFWWWDAALHTASGIILGFVGFLLIYALNHNEKVELSLNPFFMALFTCAFTVLAGVVWEIFEFGADQIFGMNMQKDGIVDTMWDLILDFGGGVVVATYGYFYARNQQNSWLKRGLEGFMNLNRGLFRKKDK